MTVNELVTLLSRYPPEAEVRMSHYCYLFDIDNIDVCFNQDTNKPCVILSNWEKEDEDG